MFTVCEALKESSSDAMLKACCGNPAVIAQCILNLSLYASSSYMFVWLAEVRIGGTHRPAVAALL